MLRRSFATVLLRRRRSNVAYNRVDSAKEGCQMGDRAKGKDKGKLKKKPKAAKPGLRPHEQQRQVSDVLKRDT
jgi:hypothetical protein